MYNMKDDFNWFKEERDMIICDHHSEYVVIQNHKVLGYFKTDTDAIKSMKPTPLGNFIVQPCLKDDVDYYYTGRYAFK